jgi:hypothetical protein
MRHSWLEFTDEAEIYLRLIARFPEQKLRDGDIELRQRHPKAALGDYPVLLIKQPQRYDDLFLHAIDL